MSIGSTGWFVEFKIEQNLQMSIDHDKRRTRIIVGQAKMVQKTAECSNKGRDDSLYDQTTTEALSLASYLDSITFL